MVYELNAKEEARPISEMVITLFGAKEAREADPDRPFAKYGNDQIVTYLDADAADELGAELGRGVGWEDYKRLLSPELQEKVEVALECGEEVQVRIQ